MVRNAKIPKTKYPPVRLVLTNQDFLRRLAFEGHVRQEHRGVKVARALLTERLMQLEEARRQATITASR